MYFSNGIVLSSDETELFFAETAAGRVSRVGVDGKGKKTLVGTHFGDNLTPNDGKSFWVAHPTARDDVGDAVFSSAIARRLFRKITHLLTKPFCAGVLLNEKGETVMVYEDKTGTLLKGCTSFCPHKDYLYVGTYMHPYVARCKLK